MTTILETLDAEIGSVHGVAGAPDIIIFYTEEPWMPETGVAVLRAMRERYWNWHGLVVNLRPGADIAALSRKQAHDLYMALHALFDPDSGHVCAAACQPEGL